MEKREINGEAEWDFKLIWNLISKVYLYGEYYLQNVIANLKLNKIEEMKEDAQKLYLFIEEYAHSNLFRPIYLQTSKECCEYIDHYIKQKRLYENKGTENQFLNKMFNIWNYCIYLKNGQNYHFEENLKGQRNIWMEKFDQILATKEGNKFRNILITHSKQVEELFNLTPKELFQKIDELRRNRVKVGQSSKNIKELKDEELIEKQIIEDEKAKYFEEEIKYKIERVEQRENVLKEENERILKEKILREELERRYLEDKGRVLEEEEEKKEEEKGILKEKGRVFKEEEDKGRVLEEKEEKKEEDKKEEDKEKEEDKGRVLKKEEDKGRVSKFFVKEEVNSRKIVHSRSLKNILNSTTKLEKEIVEKNNKKLNNNKSQKGTIKEDSSSTSSSTSKTTDLSISDQNLIFNSVDILNGIYLFKI